MDADEIIRRAKAGPGIRLFSDRAIAAGTALGGPITGCYLLAHNFKSLHESVRAKKSLIFGILVTLIVSPFIAYIPDLAPPLEIQTIIFRIISGVIFYFIVRHFQKNRIKIHRENDLLGSGLLVFVAGIAGAAISSIYILTILSLFPFHGTTEGNIDPNIVRLNKTGISNNLASLKIKNASGILYYDSLTIKQKDAETFGKLISQIGYFKNRSDNEADVYKKGDAYIVDIDVQDPNWFDPQAQKRNRRLIDMFSKSFPNNKFQIILVYIDSSGVMQKYYTDIK